MDEEGLDQFCKNQFQGLVNQKDKADHFLAMARLYKEHHILLVGKRHITYIHTLI